MKTLITSSNGTAGAVPVRRGSVRNWTCWAPYAAVAWSLVYGVMGILWAVSGRGFPYSGVAEPMGPLLGQFGPIAGWVVVTLAGLPAAVMAWAMLRGMRGKVLRPLFITLGALLAGALLLLMLGLDLLVLVGYIPYTLRSLLMGSSIAASILTGWVQWTTIHQIVCLAGGFLWLAATVVYARRSSEACLVCGRRDGPQGWTSPERAARWGRIAVYVGLVPPLFYAFTRYAWALGWPLGMSRAYWQDGQERGLWVSGLFLATFGLVGALLSLGLIQRWGQRFPRWMLGLSGKQVPIPLAVVPAALASVLIGVGGIGIVAATTGMLGNMQAAGVTASELLGGLIFQLGPALLFPLWGLSLAVATLGYYFRQRGSCKICGRGGLPQRPGVEAA